MAEVDSMEAVRSAQGRPKRSDSEGRCCHNEECYYWGVTNSAIHALVFDGGRNLTDGERVRLLKCQNCGSKFCGRRDTVMYWLKTSTTEVSRVMRALAEGVRLCSKITWPFPKQAWVELSSSSVGRCDEDKG